MSEIQWVYLQAVWQRDEVSSEVLTQPCGLLLSFGVLGPGQGEGGGEEEARLQAPVWGKHCAHGGGDGGRSNGLGALGRDIEEVFKHTWLR